MRAHVEDEEVFDEAAPAPEHKSRSQLFSEYERAMKLYDIARGFERKDAEAKAETMNAYARALNFSKVAPRAALDSDLESIVLSLLRSEIGLKMGAIVEITRKRAEDAKGAFYEFLSKEKL